MKTDRNCLRDGEAVLGVGPANNANITNCIIIQTMCIFALLVLFVSSLFDNTELVMRNTMTYMGYIYIYADICITAYILASPPSLYHTVPIGLQYYIIVYAYLPYSTLSANFVK